MRSVVAFVTTMSLIHCGSPGLGTDASTDSITDVTTEGDAHFDQATDAGDENPAVYADISAGQGTQSGIDPSAVIDTVNGKLLVVTDDNANSGKPALFRCNLDGTGCTYTDISAGQGAYSGVTPSAVIDTASTKLLVVTANGANSSTPGLFRCNLDGSGCAYADISAAQGPASGHNPRALIDSANAKLLVVTDDFANGDRPALFRCNLDGTGCTYTDISAGQGASSGLTPAAIIDTVNGKLLVATQTNTGDTAVFRCNLDGTACTFTSLSGGNVQGGQPSVVIDAANATLLVVTNKPAAFVCTLDVSTCSLAAILDEFSVIPGANVAQSPSAVFDAVHQTLLFATDNASGTDTPGLFRCDLNGNNCSFVDLSARFGAGYHPSAVIDSVNHRLLVATDDHGNSDRPALFSVGL